MKEQNATGVGSLSDFVIFACLHTTDKRGRVDARMASSAASPKPPAFDETATRVLVYARDEAMRLRNNYIGPEHVFVGLLREREGLAARVLEGHSFDLARVLPLLEARRGTTEVSTPPEMLPRTRKLVELAAADAAERGTPVATEHLLLGLLREFDLDGALVDPFEQFHVNRENIRRATVAALKSRRPAP